MKSPDRPDLETLDPTLAATVRRLTGVAWSRARALCAEGRVTVNEERCLDAAARIPPDAVVAVDERAPRLRADEPLPTGAVVFADRDVVVLDKPAGMLCVADEPGNHDNLADHTRTLLRRGPWPGADVRLGVVHRIDRETSGLVVFARTASAQRHLAAQFRARDIDRVYHAIVHGVLSAKRVETHLLPDRGDGLRGSWGRFRRPTGDAVPPAARRAVTHVKPLAALAGATLVECRLETGRQHQVRIHLSELGHPLLGERVYIRDYDDARFAAPRMMLHALALGFAHPRTGARMRFEREPPGDFRALVESLRADRD